MGTLGMRYSLVSREVIADSIETVVGCQSFDGVVAIGAVTKHARLFNWISAIKSTIYFCLWRLNQAWSKPYRFGHSDGRSGKFSSNKISEEELMQ